MDKGGTRLRPHALLEIKRLRSGWSINSGAMLPHWCGPGIPEAHVDADRLKLEGPNCKRPDHPRVQRATLVVFVLGAGLMLTRLTVRVRDRRQRSGLGCVEATILVQRFDIQRGNHSADLCDQEQAKKQWTKSVEPTKDSPLPPPG